MKGDGFQCIARSAVKQPESVAWLLCHDNKGAANFFSKEENKNIMNFMCTLRDFVVLHTGVWKVRLIKKDEETTSTLMKCCLRILVTGDVAAVSRLINSWTILTRVTKKGPRPNRPPRAQRFKDEEYKDEKDKEEEEGKNDNEEEDGKTLASNVIEVEDRNSTITYK